MSIEDDQPVAPPQPEQTKPEDDETRQPVADTVETPPATEPTTKSETPTEAAKSPQEMIPRGTPSIGAVAGRRTATAQGASAAIDRGAGPWYTSGFGALAIVLAVVGLAYAAARRWLPSVRAVRSDVMSIVGTTSLSPKHSVSLIKLGRRFVMVGVSPDRVNALCEVVDPDEVAALMASTATGRKRGHDGFEDLLDTQSSAYRSHQEPEAGDGVSLDAQAAGARSSLMELLSKVRSLQSNE